MSKNFDAELAEDRSFTFGGNVFKWRYPHWEVTADLFDKDRVNGNATQQEGEEGEAPAFSMRADTDLAIERIPIYLDPEGDAVKRFKAVVNRKTDAVPRFQIVRLYLWLLEVTSGLPTQPPSALEPGGGSRDTSSEEGSSSPEATPTT